MNPEVGMICPTIQYYWENTRFGGQGKWDARVQ